MEALEERKKKAHKSIKELWGEKGECSSWENDRYADRRGHVAGVDWPNWHLWPSCHIPT